MALNNSLKVFTGNAHIELTRAICSYLETEVAKAEVFKFTNDNTFVRILENVRQQDVFIVQPLSAPVNDHIMELLIMIDAAKRASAGRITAVVPYYAYGRTDKKDQPRVPITARLLADLITVAGANRLLTVDLHAGQIQGFFNIPVDELTAEPILVEYFRGRVDKGWVVVAVDIGISKRARDAAASLELPLAILEKRRLGNTDRADTVSVIGDVKGKTALLFDDEVDTGGSMISGAHALKRSGAAGVFACCTHPILSGDAIEKLSDSPIEELVVTDTVPVPAAREGGKLKVLSVAPLLGEAIYRIHNDLSVGAMFQSGL
jgi:ribose-phosphate pyrophosphokinase